MGLRRNAPLWSDYSAKNEKSKHAFNYQEMRKITGKQMKTVWRKEEFEPQINSDERGWAEMEICVHPRPSAVDELNPIWTMPAPGSDEKQFGKPATQKPVALVERCLLASTSEGDLVLDPFLGGGTTAVACVRLKRGCVGIEMDFAYLTLATKRADDEIIQIRRKEIEVAAELRTGEIAECAWRAAITLERPLLDIQP